MKRLILDTNIAVAFLNDNIDIVNKIDEFDVFYLPITVCGELYFGAANSNRRTYNERRLKRFIKSCKILNSDLEVAKEYAAIRLELKQKGNPIPENDIWIAATCLTYQLPVATFDKHFGYVEGINLFL